MLLDLSNDRSCLVPHWLVWSVASIYLQLQGTDPLTPMQASVAPMEDDSTAPADSGPAQDASEAMDSDDVEAKSSAVAEPEQTNGRQAPTPAQLPVAAVTAPPAVAMFSDQATYTPMRLDMKERRYFQLLEAALGVSEYTDRVDILTWKRKDGRVLQQVLSLIHI